MIASGTPSCSARVLSTRFGVLSGPDAFPGFKLLKENVIKWSRKMATDVINPGN